MFIKSIDVLMELNLVKINYLNSFYYININQNSELFGVVYSNFSEKNNRNIIPQQKRINISICNIIYKTIKIQ